MSRREIEDEIKRMREEMMTVVTLHLPDGSVTVIRRPGLTTAVDVAEYLSEHTHFDPKRYKLGNHRGQVIDWGTVSSSEVLPTGKYMLIEHKKCVGLGCIVSFGSRRVSPRRNKKSFRRTRRSRKVSLRRKK